MKSYDSRTYGISDFVEWDNAKQLELSPRFQRRSVWSDKAKSYLMDTIVRGKPIPKVFIRQILNVSTKSSIREVVDGQQRLRTILSYLKDGFVITRSHNKEYGGVFFSQLQPETQAQILSYEMSVDVLINLPDAEILDIFGRLNSYAVILNEQEKLNANNFGPFKILSDEIGRRYNTYWTKQKVFSSNEILRMKEVNLVADLLIASIEGIKAKRLIARYYGIYEKSFPHSDIALSKRFDDTVSKIAQIFPEGLSRTEFNRPFLFYTLYTAIDHCLNGIPKIHTTSLTLSSEAEIAVVRNRLDRVSELFEIKDDTNISKEDREFLQDSRRATTDEAVRIRRTKYILKLMSEEM